MLRKKQLLFIKLIGPAVMLGKSCCRTLTADYKDRSLPRLAEKSGARSAAMV